MQKTFLQFCENGNLDGLKALDYTTNLINIHDQEELGFYAACRNGKLEVIKFLISLEPIQGKIDIHGTSETMFHVACSLNYWQIVKYLVSLEPTHGKINIHISGDFMFRHYDCFTIRRLLISLDPKYEWFRYRDTYHIYERQLYCMTQSFMLLHAAFINTKSDIFDSNVLSIVKEYLFWP